MSLAARGLGLLLLPVVAGCAQIGLREPVVTERRVVSTSLEPEVTRTPANEAEPDGTMAHVTAQVACTASEREIRHVELTYSRERYNGDPKKDYGILGWAGIFAGLGAFFYVDANNLDNTSTGGSFSANDGRNWGLAMVGVGAALAVIPLIDALRAQGSEDETRRTDERGKIARQDLPCYPTPSPDVAIQFSVGNQTVDAGHTDSNGRLDVDLAKLLPPEAVLTDPDGQIDVTVGGSPAGHLPVAPLVPSMDDLAWSRVDMPGCLSALQPGACQSVSRYLAMAPNGRHADAARQALDQVEGAMRAHIQAAQAAAAARAAEEQRKEEALRAAEAQAEAAQQARAACRSRCAAACRGIAACVSQCVTAKCP